jgi:transcriptional regulator with XRE-family HTH domain
MDFSLKSPEEILLELSCKFKKLRLTKKWKRSTLSKRSGVPESTLRRFEQTGKVSMENFLKLIYTMGRLDEMEALLNPPSALSINDLEKNEKKIPKRGTL